MPTSNGLITSRDLRQRSVKSLHIVDEAVATAKLADLAVTTTKNETVIDWDWSVAQVQNVSITTSWAAHVSTDIDVPSWATLMALSTHVQMQATITVDTTFAYWTTIDQPGEPDGAWTEELAATGTRHSTMTRYWQSTVTPGSTITVEHWIETLSGSNSSNVVRLEALAWFAR